MKILLAAVNAKYIHSNLAVYSLRAFTKKRLGSQVDIIVKEYTINQDREKILADIYYEKADLTAFSCYIWNIVYVKDIVSQLKKLQPEKSIWLGGPEVSYHPQQLLTELPIDGIMLGEGEITFSKLVECYLKGTLSQLRQIDGIACKGFQTGPGKLPDMNKLPFIYEDISGDQFTNRIIYYESSRGCPFQCTYCLSSIDKQVRNRDMVLVERELDFFLAKHVPQVKFVDRTFNCNANRAVEIWKYIKEHDNGITNFHFEIAADIMTDEEVRLIQTMRPGLIQLEIGVQTTNMETIAAINRRMDFDRVAAFVVRLQEAHNIHLHLDLIAGLPKEDLNSFIKSFNDVYSLHPQQLQLGFLKILKGTPIEETALQKGTQYWSIPPYEVLFTEDLSYEDVWQLKQVEEMLEMYYNSGQFTCTIQHLEEYFPTYFALYKSLADFYRENGFDILQPSRVRKYEILFMFAETIEELSLEKCKEWLTMDIYLRENLKKRPAFSKPQNEYKTEIQEFYSREEKNRQYLSDYRVYDGKQLMKMTHIEVFDTLCEKRQVYLFDYRQRDILTMNAKLIDITEAFGGKKCYEEADKRNT